MDNKLNITNTIIEQSIGKNYFQTLDFFPTGIVLIDKSTIIKNINYLGLNLFDCEIENLIGKSISDFLDEDCKENFEKLFRRSSSTLEPQTAELLIKKPNGTNINILAIIRFTIEPATNELLCSVAMIDYTPQKMKEEIIKQSEIRFKTLANTAPVMIWISDVEGLFSFVNNIWLEYTGGEIGEQLGMNWLRNVHPEDIEVLVESYQNIIISRSPFTFEFRFRNKENKYEWMLIKGKPRFSNEKIFMGFIGSCFSINEQKEIEAKVSTINAELIEINMAKDKLFSIISHDLRSPLSGLMGILEILATSYETLEENEKREIITNAAITSKTTYRLIENLLEWSRIQTGKIQAQLEYLNLYSLIYNSYSIYENNIKNKALEFIIDVDRNLIVYADKTLTETILRNLISNAIKFSHSNGVIIISVEESSESIIVKVSDTGTGIDENDIQYLFRVDKNYSTKGTAKETGTGLGLIICKELVEKQDGRIWVESKKREGSVFHFTIPLRK